MGVMASLSGGRRGGGKLRVGKGARDTIRSPLHDTPSPCRVEASKGFWHN